MIDLNELAKQTLYNANKRMCNGANISIETSKMLKDCATEVVEAMEAYSEYSKIKNFADDINATDMKKSGNCKKSMMLVRNTIKNLKSIF